jgi:copper chaperone CopZ
LEDGEGKKVVKRLTVHTSPADCIACTLAMEERVKKMKGVVRIIPVMMMNTIHIDFDPTKVESEEIRRVVEKLGYKTAISGGS